MYQLDIYVNDVARKKGKKMKYSLVDMLDRNLIGDGICDMISGVVGGPAGTNYGENISTMAITKVFSVPGPGRCIHHRHDCQLLHSFDSGNLRHSLGRDRRT